MRYFDQHPNWKEAEAAWDRPKETLKEAHPLKVLRTLPKMPGISPCAKKNFRLKTLLYLLKEDQNKIAPKYLLKSPIKYLYRLIKSYLTKKPFHKTGDFYFYNLKDIDGFKEKLKKKETLFVLGFSYCHKPLECPSGRFTDQCIHDAQDPVCRQCFIGKSIHSLPEEAAKILIIPTVHYIGEKMFEIKERNSNREVLFFITACEMTLTMFADWGNMLNLKGVGIRLDGRICNTMKAFELSERGIKPGLTVVLNKTQQEMLELLRLRRETFSS